jgi:Zn-dependent peptidase ImmA (M78 family)
MKKFNIESYLASNVKAEDLLLAGIHLNEKYRKIPLDIESFALDLGLSIEIKDLKDKSCMIDIDNKKYKIILNLDTSPYHRRFSIAHSIGHLVCEDIKTTFIEPAFSEENKKNNFIKKSEEAANDFAANLLVPLEWLSYVLKQRSDITYLCLAFGVPEKAISHQLQKLS